MVSYLKPLLGGRLLVRYAAIALFFVNILICIPVHWIYLSIIRGLLAVPVFLIDASIAVWLAQLSEHKFRGICAVSFTISLAFGVLLSGLVLYAIYPGSLPGDYGYNGSLFFVSFLPTFIISVTIVCVTFFFKENEAILYENNGLLNNEVIDDQHDFQEQ